MYLYCTKCGTQNPGNAKVCSSCSQSLSVLPDVSLPFAKTSVLAIWSLVLGTLTFFGGFFTAIPAVICGILGLVKINKYKLKGTGFAIAGITISLCIVMLQILIMLHSLGEVRYLAQRMVCGTNLSGIGKALLIYADDDKYELYPSADRWCDLLVEKCDVAPKQLHCPFGGVEKGKSAYAFNINITGKKFSEIPPDMVLIFETAQGGWNMAGGRELVSTKNHRGDGCNILFADGHCKFEKDPNSLRWTAE